MCNNKGKKYTDKIIDTGKTIGEYLEYLELREEYNQYLLSPVADVCNYNPECKAGTVCAGTFLNYFVIPNVPYIHIDVGCGTINKNTVNSYGILLLYRFLKKL
jgi:leucyl aminopeptidase